MRLLCLVFFVLANLCTATLFAQIEDGTIAYIRDVNFQIINAAVSRAGVVKLTLSNKQVVEQAQLSDSHLRELVDLVKGLQGVELVRQQRIRLCQTFVATTNPNLFIQDQDKFRSVLTGQGCEHNFIVEPANASAKAQAEKIVSIIGNYIN